MTDRIPAYCDAGHPEHDARYGCGPCRDFDLVIEESAVVYDIVAPCTLCGGKLRAWDTNHLARCSNCGCRHELVLIDPTEVEAAVLRHPAGGAR